MVKLDKVLVWEEEKILDMRGGDGCTTSVSCPNATELFT